MHYVQHVHKRSNVLRISTCFYYLLQEWNDVIHLDHLG